MSVITNVVVVGAGNDVVERLNEWLDAEDEARHQQLMPIKMDGAGGTKWFCDTVWAASLNFAPFGLIAKLRDPETWGHSVATVSIIVVGEEEAHAFVFDSDSAMNDASYRPTMDRGW